VKQPAHYRDMTQHHNNQEDHSLCAILRLYWRAYRGMRGVAKSPFLWMSLVLVAASAHFWLVEKWWEQVLSILPNLLGFTLGGFAIFLGFGDDKFKSIISGSKAGDITPSPYLQVCAAFLHFVLIQTCGIVVALLAQATDFPLTGVLAGVGDFLNSAKWIAGLLGYWLFLYGLCLAAAAALAVFRVAYWFDTFKQLTAEDD